MKESTLWGFLAVFFLAMFVYGSIDRLNIVALLFLSVGYLTFLLYHFYNMIIEKIEDYGRQRK